MEILYLYTEYLSTYSERTKEAYLECVKLFLKYLEIVYGKVNPIIVCNIKQSDIYNYIAYIDNLSPGTKKNRLNALKNFYSFLKIRQDYFEDIKLFDLNKKLPYFLSLPQCRLLFDYYKDDRNRLLIYLLLTTGIRLAEVTNLRAENINLDERYFIIMCKGSKERKVFLNQKCTNMIRDYLNGRVEGSLFNLKSRSIQDIVTKALRGLGLKGSVHTLRHTSATLMYKSTKDILLVKEFLGHSTIVSTQIYTHVDNDEVRKCVESNPLANFGGVK